jgi:hypothetical protein
MQQSIIPTLYHGPFRLPLHWQDEQSGQLPAAIRAYLYHSREKEQPFTDEQRQLVIQWCRYYINAPCWVANAMGSESEYIIAKMREVIAKAALLQTADDITVWIQDCLGIGIDPL